MASFEETWTEAREPCPICAGKGVLAIERRYGSEELCPLCLVSGFDCLVRRTTGVLVVLEMLSVGVSVCVQGKGVVAKRSASLLDPSRFLKR
jgi:hypothetical protein